MFSRRSLKIIAHRGGALEAYENSISAINQAIALGVDVIEIDAHKTADNQYVLVHDDNLLRLTGQDQLVAETNYEDIGPYLDTIQGDTYASFTKTNADNEKPPLLSAALDALKNSRLLIDIDMKVTDDADIRAVLDIVVAKGLLHRVSTLAPVDLATFRNDYGPNLTTRASAANALAFMSLFFTGGITGETLQADILSFAYNYRTYQEAAFYNIPILPDGTTFAQVLGFLDERWKSLRVAVDYLKRKGIPSFSYVGNYDEDFESALKLGVNGLMTDKPADLLVYLKARRI